MTREELFSAFPRPWRLDANEAGVIVDANGDQVLVVDVERERDDMDVHALAEVLVELGNSCDMPDAAINSASPIIEPSEYETETARHKAYLTEGAGAQ
jgi:hypothetical protein